MLITLFKEYIYIMISNQHNDIGKKIKGLGSTAIDFFNNIYTEHLEEISFFYGQRLYLFDDPVFYWPDIETIEKRIVSHLEALVIGESIALDLCRKKAVEGDFGELYAAVRTFCYFKREDYFQEVLDQLDFGNRERVKAFIDAVNHGLPKEWTELIRKMILSEDSNLIIIAAEVIGYRRMSMETELITVLTKNDNDALPKIIWAIGRLRLEKTSNFLLHLIDKDLRNNNYRDSIKNETFLTLLRIGEKKFIRNTLAGGLNGNYHYLLLGICGHTASIPALQKISTSSNICDEALLSLGLLGDISSVKLLIDCLSNNNFATTAAISLNLITGADLYEDVFIPDEIDEDTLFEDELEKLKMGEPLYPPGKEPGENVNRLTQDPETWEKWWDNNNKRFEDKVSYRAGLPCSPAGILKTLASEKSSHLIRQLAYEEFVIRYDTDFYFDITMPVSEQLVAINSYRKWINNK